MEYILSALWNGLQMAQFFFWLAAFLPLRVSSRRALLYCGVLWLFSMIYTNLGMEDAYKQSITFVVMLAVAQLTCRGKLFIKVLLVALSMLLFTVIQAVVIYGTIAVMQISFSELVWRKWTYTITATVGTLLGLFLAWMLYYSRRQRSIGAIRQKWLLLMLLFPLTSLCMLYMILFSSRDQADVSVGIIVLSALLALANVAMLYLMQLIEKSTAESKSLALLNQQMEIQTENIQVLEKNYRLQRKSAHEYHNQIQTVHDLLLAEKYPQAKAYVRELQGMQTTRVLAVNSRHPIVDTILNAKYQMAQEGDIDIQVDVNDLSGLDMPTNVLVVILSNLLDNAIEACLRLEGNRKIQCRIVLEETLYLSVRNTSLPVVITDGHVPSSKDSPENHGYGLINIRLTLERLKAEYVFSWNDGWFEFAAEIPHG